MENQNTLQKARRSETPANGIEGALVRIGASTAGGATVGGVIGTFIGGPAGSGVGALAGAAIGFVAGTTDAVRSKSDL